MKKLFIFLTLLPSLVLAAGPSITLDKAPDLTNDMAALQRGAKTFVNYCLNCHSAESMRYNRLGDIGLSDEQIKANLLFSEGKVGDTMSIAMSSDDAKKWFGAAPPDLSLIARSRASKAGTGADYLYTFLRTYYRDHSKLTGWNNMAFPNVGMPHVLWELQGEQKAIYTAENGTEKGEKYIFTGFEQTKPGQLSPIEYDRMIADLTNFLVFVSEPVRSDRVRLGVVVMLFLGLFTLFAWRLNAAYWKDIK